MKQLLHEFLLLCGSKGKRVKQSVIFGFFDGIFEAMPFCAVFYLFYHLEQLSWNASFLTLSDAGIVAAIFLVGVIGRWIMKFCIYRFQSVASYEAIADARLAVGDHLKQAPMGFFNSETIGNTVTTLTDDMHYIEQNAANILEKTINGCINVFVMTLGVFVFDWRLGLIFLMGAILSLAIISSMQKAGISVAAKAKESQNAANGKVVEYLHGLYIYKLFPGSRQQSVNIEKVFGDLRDASFNMEKTFIRKNLSYTLVIRLACGIITILTALLAFGGQMGIAKAAVLLIATFVLYQPLENLGNISAMVRMMEVSLKRIEKMKKMPVMEGENQTPLQYDIRFENVSFQYEQNQSDAHILLTVRPLDEQGKWQYKTEKEYLCMKNGEERGFTAAEFRTAQADGWEKQYPYKVGRKKVYMTPSAAETQGLVRADKHPKSTRYGRQNPISERWNSEEQLVAWRAAWADVSNRYLERAGREERIDHRSNAAQGIDEIPTIHEGVAAQALERKGIISDRCEIGRASCRERV